MPAAILAPCLVALAMLLLPATDVAADSRPAAGQNNVWHRVDDTAETAIVFVHGLGSDSRDAWFHEGHGVEDDAYWPDLVRRDATFAGSAIFLGGFHSRFDSHDYDFRDAANELHLALLDRIAPAAASVLDHRNILFVAHSAGGIVVRDMLVRKAEDFADKAVGLVLIASPSIGTPDADRLRFIADVVHSEQGRQLTVSNAYLRELDKNFKSLVHGDRIPHLAGQEWLEHHLIISKLFGIWRDEVLVDEDTAARYFAESLQIPGSDHRTIAKPTGMDHESHRALRVFYGQAFSRVMDEAALASKPSEPAVPPTPPFEVPAHPIVKDITTEQPPASPELRGASNGEGSIASSRVAALEKAIESQAALSEALANAGLSPAAAEPVRIDEKKSAMFCGDRVQVEVTSVWKRGDGKPKNVISVASRALASGEAVAKVGETLTFAGGCQVRLIDTGRDGNYYAIFDERGG